MLGGGISGLSAAWKLSLGSHSREVLLFESTGRLGGWMRSEKTENGSIFEIGPRSIRTAGISAKTVLELVRWSISLYSICTIDCSIKID